jgi:signal transduction histidine kinase
MQTQNLLTELNSVVLFGYVARQLQNKKISVVVSPEQSIGTKVDIYGLLLVLDYLASSIKHKQKGIRLSCEIHIGKQFIYFDFVWSGPFIPPAAVEKMLAKKLEHSIGAMTVAAILNSMGGDIWSQQQEKAQSTLRLALPITIKAGNEP